MPKLVTNNNNRIENFINFNEICIRVSLNYVFMVLISFYLILSRGTVICFELLLQLL
jgi:hypothetical protein